jgi:rubredoxin
MHEHRLIERMVRLLQSERARNVCGYVYDPVRGDLEYGLVPGVSFEDLGDDWVCPVCYASKSHFTNTQSP